jgi:signal transduction histidine kinase
LATWGRVDLQLDAQRWAMALVEPDAVEDAIANVVGNAVKYVPRGGHVHVRVFATADGFTVEVRDDGPGIAASMREVIVRPGVRVTSGCGVDGTGQGLAIVAATMDRSGGHLELDDAPGRGAIVRLVFPSATVSPEAPIACDDQHTDLADSLPLVHQ